MTSKIYEKTIEPSVIAEFIVDWFKNIEFETQSQLSEGVAMIQARKMSTLRSALGGARAFSIIIKTTNEKIQVEVTTGKWAQNLGAVGIGTLLTGGLSLVGSGMAAGWTKKIESDLWQDIDKRILLSSEIVETPEYRDCPFCAEKIKIKAVVCRFCNRDLQ